MSDLISERRRREVIDALRRGTVPQQGLDVLAVGLSRFESSLDEQLDVVASSGAVFKAVRGEYGSGKTFFSRWLAERAKQRGFAVAEVQISETETPLHRLETVYRRITESLSTAEFRPSALRSVLDSWIFTLEEDALAEGGVSETDETALTSAVDGLMERRLGEVARSAPQLATALRAFRRASAAGDNMIAEGIVAWLGAQPHVSSAVKRFAGVKGDLDHFGAMSSLQGLLAVLKDSGQAGLLVVLDEVETLQRVRGDVRDKALNALRQLVDEIDAGRFPGLYLLITGTPAFYDGPQGMQRLAPLAQRLASDFGTDPRFDTARSPQLRLPGFTLESLGELGRKVRNLFVDGSEAADRVRACVDDTYIEQLASAVAGSLAGRVGVAPRVFLKKLVNDVLDRVDEHEDFDPRRDYKLTLSVNELSDVEQNAAAAAGTLHVPQAASADDVNLDI
nr:BREX system ATP-binding protein BrxD [Kibdelosporangium sp. MJ126-NF4]CEL19293.1 putative ATP/GTP binding protein [Kibdelosporangium sp. MJ126-NF4]CTQ94908.1 putative ATP/GTP binding protein [Kibdelosporangium sp. MJ126-NF4]